MNRRRFLRINSAALATGLLPFGQIFSYPSKSVVWEVSSTSTRAFAALFSALGGVENLITKDLSRATVVLKPNLCLPHRTENATTTSPVVVDALCQFLLSKGIKRIIITDHTLRDTGRFQNIELNQLVEKYPEVKLVLANKQRLYQLMPVNGKVLKEAEILKLVTRADFLINLATAKHHSATHVSLSIKNLMGLIWNRSDFHTKLDLSQAIADLALAILPHLNIIDASRVLLNGGPTGPGPVITENRLFASTDILAVDSIVTSNYNFGGKAISPKEVPHLRAAYQNGIGEIDPEKIKVEKIDI